MPKTNPNSQMTFTDDSERHIHRYLCIGCPMGCRLEVEDTNEGEIVEVRGFSCKRGEAYAKQEHVEPKRMVTTTIAIDSGLWARLPVHTTAPVPKDRVMAVCQALHQLHVTAPITRGEVVCRDVLGTGVDVMASRSMPVGG